MSHQSAKSSFIEPKPVRGVNTIALITLIQREIGRFIKVYMQTLVAPMVTTLLFYAIFALAFDGDDRKIGDVPYLQFLAPGLIMMSMVQNAFGNTSSSIVISKVQGNIIDILIPPLSEFEIMAGFIIGGLVRGLAVGVVSYVAVLFFIPPVIHAFWAIIVFAVLGNMMLSSIGVLAGLWSDKFDQMAAVTNFVITPLTFLSGTFYSVQNLPGAWHVVAFCNPFFYMIDGFRYGFTGHADSNVLFGVLLLTLLNIVFAGWIYGMLRSGYKIRS